MGGYCDLYKGRPSKIISTVDTAFWVNNKPVEQRVSFKGTCEDTEEWYKDQDWFEAGNSEWRISFV